MNRSCSAYLADREHCIILATNVAYFWLGDTHGTRGHCCSGTVTWHVTISPFYPVPPLQQQRTQMKEEWYYAITCFARIVKVSVARLVYWLFFTPRRTETFC